MESSEALVKGFFIGFLAAQFVSGWISGPLILVVLFLYVFLGNASRKVGNAVLSKLPVFAMRYFAGLPVVQHQQQQQPQFTNVFDAPLPSDISTTGQTSLFPTPFYGSTTRV